MNGTYTDPRQDLAKLLTPSRVETGTPLVSGPAGIAAQSPAPPNPPTAPKAGAEAGGRPEEPAAGSQPTPTAFQPAGAAPTAPAGVAATAPKAPPTTQPTPPVQAGVAFDHVPLDHELATLPANVPINTPYGQVIAGGDGERRVVLNTEGQARLKEAHDRAVADFGDHPFKGIEGVPAPPIRPGRRNLNPFKPNWKTFAPDVS